MSERKAVVSEPRIKSFRDLRIWQESMVFVEEIYKITTSFPKTEVYSLTSQMQRAAISIPSNIAEGFRRNYAKEYKQFLGISLGSCGELETQIEIARRLSYLSTEQATILLNKLEYICKMIQSLIKKL